MGKQRTVKEIKVDVDKCTGCRACELACSAFHAVPTKYGSINPARARIRVAIDEPNDVYLPIRAGDYAEAECNGRHTYTINGKEYGECSFCGASCPTRDFFKEPDSGLPLKCDMCQDEPPQPEPLCVQACQSGALTYVERVEETKAEKTPDMEVALDALVRKHGLKKVQEAFALMSNRKGTKAG